MSALPDITDVIDRIWFWISKSDPNAPLTHVPSKIAAAYNQKGGWEGWAQVEIAYLVQQHYANVTIGREVNVYTGTQLENDFVIVDKNDATKPKQLVELKCERGTQSASQFKQSFIDDIAKINKNPIDAAYKPAKSYAVAISCTEASLKLLMETEQWPGDIKITRVECTPSISIWWYEKDIV